MTCHFLWKSRPEPEAIAARVASPAVLSAASDVYRGLQIDDGRRAAIGRDAEVVANKSSTIRSAARARPAVLLTWLALTERRAAPDSEKQYKV